MCSTYSSRATLVRCAQSFPEPGDLGRDPVDHAAVRAPPRRPVRGRVPGAEQPLEHHARFADRRKRLAGRGPGERGRIGAVVVVGAAAAAIDALDAEFQRGEHRLPPEALRVQLVERRADEDVGPLRLLRMGLGQEHCRRSVVVAADLLRPERFRRPAVGVAHDRQVLAERLQGLELAVRDQLEAASGRRRREKVAAVAPVARAGDAHRLLDGDQPGEFRRLPRGGPQPGGSHCVEQGQRHAGAGPPQEGAPREVLAGDDVHEPPPLLL